MNVALFDYGTGKVNKDVRTGGRVADVFLSR